MNKRFSWLLMILVLLSLLNLLVRGGVIKNLSAGSGIESGEYSAFIDQVIYEIEENYVEEVDSKKLLYGALEGIIFSLNDPHSSFIDPDSYKQFQQDTRGHFGGLGIVISMRDGYLTVISTLEDKPAEQAGVKADDRILKISGKSTQGINPEEAIARLRSGADPARLRELLGITLPEAVNQLRGPVGEPVTITLGREGEEPRELTIKRRRIDVESLTDVRIVEEGIGYIKLTGFHEETVHELGKAIDKLEAEGMKSLILDLRDNPGGLLNSAVGVADRFIPDGNVIVSTRGREQSQSIERVAEDGFPRSTLPLAVLVNKYSASGSEIVAGALQDWSCAVIIGEKTYGKGSVQNLIPLKDGSALRLTTARYYSPKGRVIDKVGITPDIESAVEEDEEVEGKGKVEGEEKKDPQLTQAINALKAFDVLRKNLEGEGRGEGVF